MMAHAALDTGTAHLPRLNFLWLDHLAAGNELRLAILDDEHVVGGGVYLGAALHAAIGDDGQTVILEDALTLDEGGRNLVVADIADLRRKSGGHCHGDQGRGRNYRGECK